MRAVILTDQDSDLPMMVMFGEGGVVGALRSEDDCTDLSNESGDVIASVKETPKEIMTALATALTV